MAETMYAAPGIGLAATQVDVHERVLIIDISETRDAAAGVRESRDRRSERRGRNRGRLPFGPGRLRQGDAAPSA